MNITKKQKIPYEILPYGQLLPIRIADIIDNAIRANRDNGRKTVLGLAAGSSPLPIYSELIRRRNYTNLDFSNVVTFNVDEYYGLPPIHPESFCSYMGKNLLDHINVKEENTHFLDGSVSRSHIERHCSEYESAIKEAGGIDILLLGIGRNGHIGFNEPGSSIDSRTRLVKLDEMTRQDAAQNFGCLQNVPEYGITMGVGTILEAKYVILIATGHHKAELIRKTIQDADENVTASYLNFHVKTRIFLDRKSASGLKPG